MDVIFQIYSSGVKTNRDAWVYNFNRDTLAETMNRMIETYNAEVDRWKRHENREANVNDFVVYDDTKIKWDRELRQHLKRGRITEYTERKVRNSLYRPFTKSNLYFDRIMNNCVYVLPSIFPTPKIEIENRVICLTDKGSEKPFMILMSYQLTDLHVVGAGSSAQCFPFYTYDEDGTNRRENITDWALAQFRAHYRDESIGKWDIFHYVYALLHHPDYRERYEANLKRDLPHIPFGSDFWEFAKVGQRLGEIHIGYEDVPEYPLHFIENREVPSDSSPRLSGDPVTGAGRGLWRVEKMKLSKDKTQLIYNDFLTLDGIPAQAFDYKLGNRAALEWVIDQYRVKTDKRNGIVNDPNRADDPAIHRQTDREGGCGQFGNSGDCGRFACLRNLKISHLFIKSIWELSTSDCSCPIHRALRAQLTPPPACGLLFPISLWVGCSSTLMLIVMVSSGIV